MGQTTISVIRMGEVSRTVLGSTDVKPCVEWVTAMLFRGIAKGPVLVTLGRPTRTLDQNARMWAMLTDVSKQVDWHGQHLSPEDWKHVFSAGLHQQRAVPGIDGGFVVLGQSTRRMSKEQLSELMELIEAFGAQHEVTFEAGHDEG